MEKLTIEKIMENKHLRERTKKLPKDMASRYVGSTFIASLILSVGVGSETEMEVDSTMNDLCAELKRANFPRQYVEDGINISDIMTKEDLTVFESADLYFGISAG